MSRSTQVRGGSLERRSRRVGRRSGQDGSGRRHALRASLVLALAALTGAASGGAAVASSPRPHAGHPQATHAPLVIGAVLDLTGPGAAEGQAGKKGMDFEVRQINAAGGVNGRKIKVQSCDTQSTPAGGAQCASQLSNVNSHVVLVLGSLPSTLGAVPHLTNVVGLSIVPVLFPKRGTSMFQMSTLERSFVAPFVKAVKAAHLSKIGVIYVNEASGTAQLGAVQAVAKAAGIGVVSEPMDPGATDVTPELDQLRAQGAKVIFSATIGSADTAVVSSYHTLGLNVPLVMGAEAVSDSFLKSLSFPIPPKLYGISNLVVGPGFSGPMTRAWTKLLPSYKRFARQPMDNEGSTTLYSVCAAAAALAGTHGGPASRLKRYLETKTIKCLGTNLRFDKVPGLNVVTGLPATLAQAGPTVADGWGAVRTPL